MNFVNVNAGSGRTGNDTDAICLLLMLLWLSATLLVLHHVHTSDEHLRRF